MRELLFRGFHPCDGPDTIVVDGEKVKGRWVEGYIVRHPSAIQIGDDYNPWYIHVPPVDPDDNGGVFNVLPSTVGQYTGLTDRTGKRIFEGDVLKIAKCSDGLGGYYSPPLEYPANVMVKWDMCAWMWETLGDEKYYLSFPDAWCHYECEVIGTVFDEEAPNAQI